MTLAEEIEELCHYANIHGVTDTVIIKAKEIAKRHGEAPREGWKLVPVEPTDAMILAGAQSPGKKWGHLAAESVVHRYRAMLAAAPGGSEKRHE